MIGNEIYKGGNIVLTTFVIGVLLSLLMFATSLVCWIFRLPCFSLILCFIPICFIVGCWLTVLVLVFTYEIYGNMRQKYYDRKTKGKFY